jgi:hypothetical protein
MALKWAIIDLLKICDTAHEGRLHGDLARIAKTLGVELSEPVINPSVVVPPSLRSGAASMVEAQFSQAGRSEPPFSDAIIPQLNLEAVKKYNKKLQGKNCDGSCRVLYLRRLRQDVPQAVHR